MPGHWHVATLCGIHGRAGDGRTAPVKHPGRYPGLSRQGRCPGFARYRPNRLARCAGAPGQPLSEQAWPREAGNAQIAGCSGLALLGAKAAGLARSRRSPGPARGTPQPTGSLQDHHRVNFAPRKCESGSRRPRSPATESCAAQPTIARDVRKTVNVIGRAPVASTLGGALWQGLGRRRSW